MTFTTYFGPQCMETFHGICRTVASTTKKLWRLRGIDGLWHQAVSLSIVSECSRNPGWGWASRTSMFENHLEPSSVVIADRTRQLSIKLHASHPVHSSLQRAGLGWRDGRLFPGWASRWLRDWMINVAHWKFQKVVSWERMNHRIKVKRN